ncbi:MAG: DUF4810 domain-containing protein [Lautropia sp.]|nr:DUF4810 domain-containing protein [Lautropia sp.]
MNSVAKRAALALMPLMLAACAAQKPMYHWGEYPDTVYTYYREGADLDQQADALKQIIADAAEAGDKVGPGVHGQLGLVLSKQGRIQEARDAFRQEQMLYPESSAFMQYLIDGGAAAKKRANTQAKRH